MPTLELTRPTPTETPAESSHSIFDYYSVPNEVAFLQRAESQGLNRSETKLYIRENVERFLGEFAGKVPYTRLSYLQKDDRLTYAGLDLTDSYEQTSHNSEREYDEYVGYKAIQEGFKNGAHTAVWISPPKMADYGFVFYFQRDPKQPNHVREFILRYDERRGNLTQSQKILDRIDPILSYKTDREYLQQPHIFQEQEGNHPTLETLMTAIGMSTEDVTKSQQFERLVQTELSDWTDRYSEAVFSGDTASAKETLQAIYNYAFDMRRLIDERPEIASQITHRPLVSADEKHMLLTYYKNEKREVSSGSCPVTQNSGNPDPFSPKNIIDQLTAGKTINGLTEETQHFTCPNCKHKADGPVGDQCPSCKITREEWAKKGNDVC